MKKSAFSLIELGIVVLIIGVVTLVALNGKSLLKKADCVKKNLSSDKITNLSADNVGSNLKDVGSSAYENCVNSDGSTTSSTPVTCSGATCTSCKTLLAANPGTASGTYTIDPDGAGSTPSFQAYCDMDSDGGGWTLVLNYLHKANTNPALSIRTSNLPIFNSATLGNDESSNSTSWGHSGNDLLNKFVFTELRFYGKTSGHSRVINFKTSLSNCLNYFKTGSGSCAGLANSFNALAGHTANLPSSANSYASNSLNEAMTVFTFHLSSNYHWGVRAADRWEVDDWCNRACDTFHQVWIR